MIGRTLSHYEILEKIGAGGMGDVYRARDSRLERDVAIKFLRSAKLDDETARYLFRREALSLSKLNHPNVQTVFDFDSEDEIDFLVTEYVPGITLIDKITAEGMPENEVLKLGEQLAAGLAAAHAAGIVHRDLKPGNLRVMPDGRLKILDFGLAKLMGPTHESAPTLSRFETQTFAGTPHYMAPEQRLGHPADARTDIYSAGLVLRELVTGEPEPREETPSKASSGLKRIIQRCLESEPEKRYPTANDLLDEIRRLQRPRAFRPAVAALTVAAAAVLAAFLVGRPDRADVGIDSVVALPSELLGTTSEEFFADAVPKTISTYLAQVEGLDTKLPPAGIEIERFEGDLDRIADTYGVKALVLSTVMTQSDDFTLNVQLVEAQERRLVWSAEYDGSQSEYLSIVREAAEELRQHLRPSPVSIAPRVGTTNDSQAELAYQRGLYYSNRFNNLHHLEDFDASHAAFEEALATDPTFGDAAAEIAWLYEFKLEAGLDPREAIPQIDSWARRTLEIDDENGRAWAVLTLLEAGQGKVGPRLTLSGLRAVRFAPRFPRSHIALGFGLPSCRLRLEAYREARLDALYLYAPAMSSAMMLCMGRPEDALVENEQALAIEPDFALGLLNKAAFLHALGRLDEADAVLDRLEPFARDGRAHPAWLQQGRDVNAVLRNELAETELAFERLRQMASGQNRFPYWPAFTQQTIDILGLQGRTDEARELTLGLDAAGLHTPYDNLMLSPSRAWIRDDPTMEPIIEKSRQNFEERLSILEKARGRGELPAYLEDPLDELLIELDMK